jgi:cobalamin biosynthesis Mg chelatase CobN
LKNVICNLDNDAVRLALTLDERGEADYNHKEMSELYKDFISDTNEIVKD